jgi:hypothetical protein
MSRRHLIAQMPLVLLFASAACALSGSAKTTTFKSPDGKMVAVIISLPEKNSEAIVELRTFQSRTIDRQVFTSADGQHGYYVSKAQWTPDSKFFVYSLESSGGHSPMVVPTIFFSKTAKASYQFFDFLGENIIFADFSVFSPDRVEVVLEEHGNKPLIVSLSELMKNNKKAQPLKSE